MLNIREQPALLFWIGLVGIVVTGSIVGMGADNYWGLANIGNLDPTVPAVRGLLLMAALAGLTGLCDLVAIGVVFAGGVILVQRLRGVA
jgi:hypothetical protein